MKTIRHPKIPDGKYIMVQLFTSTSFIFHPVINSFWKECLGQNVPDIFVRFLDGAKNQTFLPEVSSIYQLFCFLSYDFILSCHSILVIVASQIHWWYFSNGGIRWRPCLNHFLTASEICFTSDRPDSEACEISISAALITD